MFTCISERVKFCILLLMVNLFFCTCISYDSVEILGSQLFRCIHIRHSRHNKLYMTFCGKGRKNSCFIIQRNPLISYCSRDNTNQTKFLYTVRIKNKNDSDNEKNCESNAVERVISPYTIKRQPPNTVSCLTMQIYFTRGNIVYGRSVELCNLS